MELRLKEILNQRGITLKEFSTICGISAPNLSHYLNGNISPTLKSLEKIASCLNIDVTDLFKEKKDIELFAKYDGNIHPITSNDIIEIINKKKSQNESTPNKSGDN